MTDPTAPLLDSLNIPPPPPPSPDAPVADPAMFRGILGEIVAAAAPTTEADPVGILATLATAVGVIIGRDTYVGIGAVRHPLLIWTLLFGRTGSGRKGEAASAGLVFVREAFPSAYNAVKAPGGLGSGEGLIERIRDPNKDDEKDTGGTDDKRLLLVESEFRDVLARAKREGSTLSGILRQAWEGSELGVMNRRALIASWSHIGITGHITPREFRERVNDGDLSGGTYNRFLPVYVEKSHKLPIPTGVDAPILQDLSGRLRDRVEAATSRGSIGLEPAAEKVWRDEVYDEMTASDDEDSRWTEFARRAAPYCRRVAALHAVLDRRSSVTEDDLRAAAAFVRYAVASAKFVLDSRSRDPRMDRLRRAVDGAGPAGLSRKQVSDLFSRNVSKDELTKLLDELISDGRYRKVSVPTGGRPAEVYRPTKETK